MKIPQVGTELFQANRQTDGQMDIHDEAKSSFSKILLKRL
jgi:hypothetical protein